MIDINQINQMINLKKKSEERKSNEKGVHK